MELAYIQTEAERERIVEGALEATITKYLASNTFEIVKADCFLEGFENF